MKKNTSRPAWELISKYLYNEATDKEQQEIEIWAEQSWQNRDEIESYKRLSEITEMFFRSKNFNVDAAWKNVHKEYSQMPPKADRKPSKIIEYSTKIFRYAAIIIGVLLLGYTGYFTLIKNIIPYVCRETISSEENGTIEYWLPDSSLVVLNSKTELSFPKNFIKNQREVKICGEAFFNIKTIPDQPFVIYAENAQITITGTSLDVCAYPDNETVEVFVESGCVEVCCPQNNISDKQEKLILNTGEKGTLFKSENKLKKSLNTDPNYLAWKTHNLIFNKTNLNEVINHLKIIYDIDIQLKEKELGKLLLTAEFKNKPVDFILNVIKSTFDLELTENNEQYILSKN